MHIGVSGASPQLVAAAVHASQLPPGVTVVSMPSEQAVKNAVADGHLDGGVAVLPGQLHLSSLLVPIVDPGATHTPGFDVVTRGTSQLGQEYAESVAAGHLERPLRGQGAPRRASRSTPATVAITTQNVGHGGKVNLNFFAPNIAVVFLFIGSGLGMRSLLMERVGRHAGEDHGGTAAADPDRPRQAAGHLRDGPGHHLRHLGGDDLRLRRRLGEPARRPAHVRRRHASPCAASACS